jgi:antitoxin component YwqK of YwqJK toxin-antitoxin module
MKIVLFAAMYCSSLASQNPLDRFYATAPDGENRISFRDGSRAQFTKEDHHIHGVFYEFYSNGQLASKVRFQKGKYIDTAYSFHKNGLIKTIDVFRHDTITYSEWDWYYTNGRLADSYRFNLQGAGVDISKRHHSKLTRNNFEVYGILSDNRLDFRKINGCRFIWLAFYEDGTKCSKKEKLSNQKDGEQLAYYKNGSIKLKEFYVSGKKHGQQFYYSRDGKEKVKCYRQGAKYSCSK